ncbi:MAG: DEAD/DEAH box helicase [Bacillota bacterium]
MLWLPLVNGLPMASSPMVSGSAAVSGGTMAEPSVVALAPWTATAVPLSAAESVEFLSACAGRWTLAPGLIVGRDLTFWAAAMRYGGGLVARELFIPSLRKADGRGYHASWEPVIGSGDLERLHVLASAMPAAARSVGPLEDAPPDKPALTVLSDFIAEVVDHLVRSAAAEPHGAAPAGRRRRHRPDEDGSLHDRWAAALRSPDGTMKGETAELDAFAVQVREWQRPVTLTLTSPFRLVFRLEEPRDGQEAAWEVRYLLQAVSDPSLLVPAEQAWNPTGPRAATFRRAHFNPAEYLLVALGQAARLCPHVEKSLRSPAPCGFELDAGGAYEFLSQTAPAMELAGFGIRLPAWWTGKGTKLRLAARAHVRSPKLQAEGRLSLASVVEFDWEVALGGERVSQAELKALAELKVPLVKLRGQWVQLSAEEIRAALALWKKRSGSATLSEVVRMALGGERAAGGVPVEGLEASGWVADFLKQLEGEATFEELTQPKGFRGTLRPYQLRGYSWLAFLRHWGLGACLADDMGLGKTIQTLALVQRHWHGNGRRPALLVCPTSVIGNWQREASRFTPHLPVMVHHGSARIRDSAAFKKEAARHAIVISSYALLARDLGALRAVPWSGVVLDEAQNIKNPETKPARAARTLSADYRIALTGTPVENNVGDLWSIMEFLNPGLLGTQAEFKRRFFIPIQADRDPRAAANLKRLTGPFILRRLKTDRSVISDLPEKLEAKVFCPLTREQASLYEAVVKEAVEALEATEATEAAEGIRRKGLVLATLSKLKQVCNHPAQFLGDNSPIPGRSGKLTRLTEMLEEVNSVGGRALIFTQFAEMGEILRGHLQDTFGREVLFLHGGVSKGQRDRMIDRFQAGDAGDAEGPAIMVLTIKAGGTGLNLTRANHVFLFDRWWNPAVESQAADRAFRIGQTRAVQVHKFICQGTLEERIDELIEAKKEVAESVVGAGEGWLTGLSTKDLRGLFALSREAVSD